MKINRVRSFAILAALALLGPGMIGARAAENDGVALAIVYDTSGSMRDHVPDAAGRSSPKYLIANRALIAIARQIEAFATNAPGGSPRTIHAALYTFHNDSATPVIPLAPFDRKAFEDWARRFASPGGNTPLGNSLNVAGKAVLDSSLPRKHVLVITDGLNTAGPSPSSVLPKLQERARTNNTSFSTHFVAFDVDAKQFGQLKKLGATVVGAADEAQLNSQLQFILQRKILLEEEEPKK
jgi:hypothetical protein